MDTIVQRLSCLTIIIIIHNYSQQTYFMYINIINCILYDIFEPELRYCILNIDFLNTDNNETH